MAFILIWVFWLWPEVTRCEERSQAWLRSPAGGKVTRANLPLLYDACMPLYGSIVTSRSLDSLVGALSSLAAEESSIEVCGKWVDWDFSHAVGWIIQLSLACITVAHWLLDLLSMRMHAAAVARQQRLRLLPSPCPKLPETLSTLVVLAVGGGVAALWTFWDLGML